MNDQNYKLLPWLVAVLLLSSQSAQAATVFRTVDENGVVNFSDTPPQDSVPVETIEIAVQQPHDPQLSQDNLEAMRETTDRMAADRKEREEQRAKMRQQQAPPQPQPYYYETAGSGSGVVSYSSSYRRSYRHPIGRDWWPGYRPKPEHPILRPPIVCPPEHGHGNRPHPGRPIAVPYRNPAANPGSAAWRPSINRAPGISMSGSINNTMRNR